MERIFTEIANAMSYAFSRSENDSSSALGDGSTLREDNDQRMSLPEASEGDRRWWDAEETFLHVLPANGSDSNSTDTWDEEGNFSDPGSTSGDISWPPDVLSSARIASGVLLVAFSAVTVFGNALVVAAVVRERTLHTPTHLFVLSLAVADGLVGLLVMPPGAATEALSGAWPFGADACDAWRSLDVLLSTASILNLCVVSLDRYWAIRDPLAYPARMGRPRAVVLVTAVWLCSAAISFPAIAWWRAVREGAEVTAWSCPFTDHAAYIVVSSAVSFYLPLLVMAFTYCKIYRTAVVQTRCLRLGTKRVASGSRHKRSGGVSAGYGSGRRRKSGGELTLRIHRGGDSTANVHSGERRIAPNSSSGRCEGKNNLSRRLARFAKEKKAAKTLGIVMGVFVVCWLPFFVVNLLSALCPMCLLPHGQLVGDVVTWLGWMNSGMNPVIYACWSRDFRRAFSRILCVCCRRRRRRLQRLTLTTKSNQYTGASTVLTPNSHSSNRFGYTSVSQELYGI